MSTATAMAEHTTSEWQARSNRRNAQLSTGPKTEAGKLASSRNAYKHGYRALIVAPDEEGPAVEADRQEWIAAINPRNKIALAYADLSFRAKRRLDQVADAEDAARAKRMDDAVHNLHERRQAELDEAQKNLLQQPMIAYRRMIRTVEGCERLIAMLDDLNDVFASGRWSKEAFPTLAALLGLNPRLRDFALEEATAALVADVKSEAARKGLGHIFTRIFEARIELERQIEALDGEEEHAQRLAFEAAKCDTSAEGRLLGRYYRDNHREFHKWTDAALKIASAKLGSEHTPISLERLERHVPAGPSIAAAPPATATLPSAKAPAVASLSAKSPAPNEAMRNPAAIVGSAGPAARTITPPDNVLPFTVGIAPPRQANK